MSRNVVVLFVLVCFGMLSAEGSAAAQSAKAHCHRKPIEFYAGLLGGIERMTGRRTDAVSDAGVVTFFTANNRMLQQDSTVSFVTGFMWALPVGPILVGPEFYFGRGNTTAIVTNADTLFNQYYTAFQRKFFYGGRARFGWEFYRNFVLTLSLGIDRSQFMTRRIYVPVGTNALNVKRTKAFNGFSYGVGLEKHFDNVLVGFDLRLTQYRRQLTLDEPSPTISMHFSVRPIIYSAALRICYRF